MAKIPMQFFILFIGAMVFVFFVFEKPPVLFQPVELNKSSLSGLSAHRGPLPGGVRAAQRGGGPADRSRAQATEPPPPKPGRLPERAGGDRCGAGPGRTLGPSRHRLLEVQRRQLYFPHVRDAIYAGGFGRSDHGRDFRRRDVLHRRRDQLARHRYGDRPLPAAHPKEASDRHYLWASRAATAFWGCYAVMFAQYGKNLGSLIVAVNMVGSLFYGGMLGVFVLAFAFPRVRGTAAFMGVLARGSRHFLRPLRDPGLVPLVQRHRLPGRRGSRLTSLVVRKAVSSGIRRERPPPGWTRIRCIAHVPLASAALAGVGRASTPNAANF